jgi:hypothetical protein
MKNMYKTVLAALLAIVIVSAIAFRPDDKKKPVYQVVPAYTYPDLAARVQQKITEGWEPLGGVCVYKVADAGTQGNYWQAMIKR